MTVGNLIRPKGRRLQPGAQFNMHKHQRRQPISQTARPFEAKVDVKVKKHGQAAVKETSKRCGLFSWALVCLAAWMNI